MEGLNLQETIPAKEITTGEPKLPDEVAARLLNFLLGGTEVVDADASSNIRKNLDGLKLPGKDSDNSMELGKKRDPLYKGKPNGSKKPSGREGKIKFQQDRFNPKNKQKS